MTYERAARVLLAELSECTSASGNRYMRGWLGASNLVAFPGEPDEQGRPTWQLYLSERQPRQDGRQGTGRAAPARESTHRQDRAQRAPQAQGTHAARLARVGSGGRQDRADEP